MFHGEKDNARYDGWLPYYGLNPVEIPPLSDVPTITKIKGGIIYDSEWPADNLVILRRGRVYSYKESLDGQRFAEMVKAPSFLGYEVLEGLREYRSTAIAFDESTAQYIDRQRLQTLIREDARFRKQLLISVLSQTKKRQDFIEAHSHGVAASIAFTLIDLAEKPNNEIHGVSHKTIYGLVGYTIRSVVSTMQRFRDKGFISYKYGGGRIPSNIELLQPNDLLFVVETGSLPPENRSTEGIRPKI